MNFFQAPVSPGRAAREAPARPEEAGFLPTVVAGFEAESIETDRLGRTNRVREEVLAEQAARLPAGSIPPFRPAPRGAPLADARRAVAEPRFARQGTPQAAAVLEAARRAKAEDPEQFGALIDTKEALEAEVTRRLKADLDEANDVLAMGGGLPAFLGRGGAAMTDETSVALTPLGLGGGTFLRTVGREALLGAAGEAAILPRMYDQAERLGIEAPDAAAQIGMGFLFGGAAGAVLEGGARGLAYLTGRRAQATATKPPGAHPYDHEARIDAAERALLDGAPEPEPALRDVARKIVQVESSGRRDATNPESSATGAGQFIESTWLAMIDRHRPDLKAGRSRAQLLALRTDPTLSAEMTAAYAADNRAYLAARGLPTDEGALYLAHFAGPEGARKALAAGEDAPITSILSEAEIAANRSIRWAGKTFEDWTAGDLRRWAEAKMAGAADPARAFSPTTRRGYTAPDQVATGSGRRVDVTYEIVDASTLTPASGALQPRDRTRAASDEQIAEIAAGLDPARLMPSPEADRGAPIVGPDGIVESGNGRVMAIRRAQEEFPDRFAAYVETIRAVAEIPEGVQTPVLIARRTSPLSETERAEFVREANRSTIARMSATETGRADAAALDRDLLDLIEPDAPLTSPANRPFVNAALARLPQAERAALVDRTGALNAEGQRRLGAALFARAYEAPDLLAAATETDAPELRTLIAALTEIAPDWAGLRADVADGVVRPEFDITPQLLDAVRLIAAARREAAGGETTVRAAIDAALAQVDAFAGAVNPVTERLVRLMHRDGRARAQADVAADLRAYAAEARAVGSAEPDLFGGAVAVGPAEVLDAVAARGGVAPPAPRSAAPERQAAPAEAGAAATVNADPEAAPAALDVEALPPAAFREGAAGSDAEVAAARAAEDLRAAIEAEGDFTMKDEAGNDLSAAELLDDLDEDDEFAGALQVCVAGATRAGGAS